MDRDEQTGRAWGAYAGEGDFGSPGRRDLAHRSPDFELDWGGRRDRDLSWSRGRVYGRDADFGRDTGWGPGPEPRLGAWMPYGPQTGRGPRGYRSDERIRETVTDRLTWHGWIDARDILVQVENGEVYLRGTVADRQMKRAAEAVAESVPGTRDIHNRLRLRQEVTAGHGARFDRDEMRRRAERLSSTDRFNVAVGAAVMGNDDKEIGTVRDIRAQDLVVERKRGRDLRIPFDAVRYATGSRVVLDVASRDASRRGWAIPAATEAATQAEEATAP